ncbi:MAG: EscU/YscU/HrcU family type III secretion system export apparatus switch protein [Phycisphaerales bacterium]|nr:EscU/YscU/HrcU family type III secretion system export apparatus switch protein [Phycisphaerales bacterium]
MSQQKTERPTPRRIRKARKDGKVPKSQSLNSAVVLLAALGAGTMLAGGIADGVREAARVSLTATANLPETPWGLLEPLHAAFMAAATPTVAFMVALMVAAGLAAFLQVGALFTLKPLTPTLSRLNPGKGIQQRVFSARAVVELLKAVLILLVVVIVLILVLRPGLPTLALLPRTGVEGAAMFAVQLATRALIAVTMAFGCVAGVDFLFQRWQHGRDLRMSHEEIKREYKESEGDPQAKAARQRLHEEILQATMIEQARSADVVIVNPEHIACALKYDPDENLPPRLVARGQDYLAQRIKEVAREEGIPIARDVPLARLLYDLEVDDFVPEELYEAVGVVLRWVAQEARARGEVTPWDHLV